jgi:hypothetical protein
MWACSGKKQDIPEEILPEKQMVEIIVDLHLGEAKLNEVKGDIEGRVVLFNAYADSIYQQHGTDSLHYISSHDFYMENLDAMKGIYQKVSDSLKILRDSAAKARPEFKKIKGQAKEVE